MGNIGAAQSSHAEMPIVPVIIIIMIMAYA